MTKIQKGKCPECDTPMEYRQGTYRGKWVCTNFNCKNAEIEKEYKESRLRRKNSMEGLFDETFGNNREEDLRNTNV